MTDKQIKDGIDVSQCECYSIKHNSCNKTVSGSCIKEKCQTFRLLQTIKAKEQEYEELKEQLTILDDEDVVVEITVKQFEEYKKLKQTLTEIKEIVCKSLGGGVREEILQKIREVIPNENKRTNTNNNR